MIKPAKKIGVLALQGGFAEHVTMMQKLGCETKEVRTIEDTQGLDGLILPGGESTTLLNLMETTGLDKWLKKTQMPMMATCAGLIVLAKLGRLDVEIERNAYGSQMDSFEVDLRLDKKHFPGIFIRAPRIGKIGKKVELLITYKSPVMIRQGDILGLTFHPELTNDTRIHELFLDMLD